MVGSTLVDFVGVIQMVNEESLVAALTGSPGVSGQKQTICAGRPGFRERLRPGDWRWLSLSLLVAVAAVGVCSGCGQPEVKPRQSADTGESEEQIAPPPPLQPAVADLQQAQARWSARRPFLISPALEGVLLQNTSGAIEAVGLKDRKPKFQIPGLTEEASTFAISPDGLLGVTGTVRGSMYLWSPPSQEPLDEFARLDRLGPGNARLIPLAGSRITATDLHPTLPEVAVGTLEGDVLKQLIPPPEREILVSEGALPGTLAFSADGQLLAVATEGGEVAVWKVEDRSRQANLRGLSGRVSSLVITAEGGWLCAGTDRGEIGFWNLGANGALTRIMAHAGGVRQLALLDSGSVLLSLGMNGDLAAHPIPPGVDLANLGAAPRSARVSGSGTKLGVITGSGQLQLWAAEGGQPRDLVPGATAGRLLEFSPDEQQLVAVTGPQRVQLISGGATAQVRELVPRSGSVRAIAFNGPQTGLLAVGDEGLDFWRLSGNREQELTLPTAALSEVSPTSRLALQVANDGSLGLYDLTLGRGVASCAGLSERPVLVTAAEDGSAYAAASARGEICVWSQRGGEPLAEFRTGGVAVSVLRISREGLLLAACQDGRLLAWNLPQDEAGSPGPLSDGELLLAGSADAAKVLVQTAERGLATLDLASGTREAVPLDWASRELERVAIGGATVALGWQRGGLELLRGEVQTALSGWDSAPDALVVSPQGDRVAAVRGSDLRWWKLVAQPGPPLRDAGVAITRLTEHPQGKLLALVLETGGVELRRTETGELLQTLPTNGVADLAWQPEGDGLWILTSQGTVESWTVGQAAATWASLPYPNALQVLTAGARPQVVTSQAVVELEAETGQEVTRWGTGESPLVGAGTSADGTQVLLAETSGQVTVWGGSPREKLGSWKQNETPTLARLSADGGLALVTTSGPAAELRSCPEGRLVHRWDLAGPARNALLAGSPTNPRAVVQLDDFSVWDWLGTGSGGRLPGLDESRAVALVGKGPSLWAAGKEGVVRRQPLELEGSATLAGEAEPRLWFSADGSRLSAWSGGPVVTWQFDGSPASETPIPQGAVSVIPSPSRRHWLVLTDSGGSIQPAPGISGDSVGLRVPAAPRLGGWSAGGQSVVLAGDNEQLVWFDPATGQMQDEISAATADCVELLPGDVAGSILSRNLGGQARRWAPRLAMQRRTDRKKLVLMSEEGGTVATLAEDGRLRVQTLRSEPAGDGVLLKGRATGLALSKGDGPLAVLLGNQLLSLNRQSLQTLHTISLPNVGLSLAPLPEPGEFAVLGADRRLRLYSGLTGQSLIAESPAFPTATRLVPQPEGVLVLGASVQWVDRPSAQTSQLPVTDPLGAWPLGNGGQFLIANAAGEVVAWDPAGPREEWRQSFQTRLTAAWGNPVLRQAVLARQDQRLLRLAANGDVDAELPLKGTVRRLHADSTARRLVAIQEDGSLVVVDLETFQVVFESPARGGVLAAGTVGINAGLSVLEEQGLWRMVSTRTLPALPRFDQKVVALATSSTGAAALVALADGNVVALDGSGRQIGAGAVGSPIIAVGYSRDGQRAAALKKANAGVEMVWLDQKLQPAQGSPVPTSTTQLIPAEGDPGLLLVDTAAGLRDPPRGEGPASLRVTTQAAVQAAQSDPLGRYFATVEVGGALRLYPTQGQSLFRHAGGVGAVCFSPDGQFLISGGGDGSLRGTSLVPGVETRSWSISPGSVCSVAVSAGSDRLAVASTANEAVVFDLNAGGKSEPLHRLPHQSPVTAVAFLPSGTQLLTAEEEGLLRVWDVLQGREIERYQLEQGATVSLGSDAAGGLLAAVNRNAVVRVFQRPLTPPAGTAQESGLTGGTNQEGGDAKSGGKGTRPAIGALATLTLSQALAGGNTPVIPTGGGEGGLEGLDRQLRSPASPTIQRMEAELRGAYSSPERQRIRAELSRLRVRASTASSEARPLPREYDGTLESAPVPKGVKSTVTRVSSFKTRYVFDPEVRTPVVMSLSADGGTLLTARQSRSLPSGRKVEGVVDAWDIPSQTHLRSWTDVRGRTVDAIRLEPSGGVAYSLPDLFAFQLATGRARLIALEARADFDGQRPLLAVGRVAAGAEEEGVFQQVGTQSLQGEGASLRSVGTRVTAVRYNPLGSVLAVALRDRFRHRLLLLDPRRPFDDPTTHQVVEEHPHSQSPSEGGAAGIDTLAFSPAGDLLIAHGQYSNSEYRIKAWGISADGAKPLQESKGTSPLLVRDLSPNLWFLPKPPPTKAGTRRPPVAKSRPRPADVTRPQETVMAIPVLDGKLQLRLLDFNSQRPLGLLSLAGDSVRRPEVAVSASGRWLAAGDDGGNVRVWDLVELRGPWKYRLHTGPITGLAWAADGGVLASASEDQFLHIWQVPPLPDVPIKPSN